MTYKAPSLALLPTDGQRTALLSPTLAFPCLDLSLGSSWLTNILAGGELCHTFDVYYATFGTLLGDLSCFSSTITLSLLF